MIITVADYILPKQASIIGGLLGVLSITMFCKGTDLIVCRQSVVCAAVVRIGCVSKMHGKLSSNQQGIVSRVDGKTRERGNKTKT